MFKYDRFNELIREKGIKKAHVCRELGKSPYYMRDAEKNNFDIRGDMLLTVARVLGVSPDYLTGASDDPSPAPKKDIPHEGLREVFAADGIHILLDADNKMPANHLLDIIDYIKIKQQENDRT